MKTTLWSRTTGMFLGGVALCAALGGLIFSATTAHAGQHKQVGPWDAMKAATAKVGGKALQATYASEKGKYLYDVVVVKGKTLLEVEVDAATGKAGESETVTPAEEGRELVAELTMAIGGKVPAGADKEEKEEDEE